MVQGWRVGGAAALLQSHRSASQGRAGRGREDSRPGRLSQPQAVHQRTTSLTGAVAMPHTARSRRLFLTRVLVSGFSAVALTGSGLVLPASLADAVSVGRSGGMMGLVTRSLATTARNCGWQQAQQGSGASVGCLKLSRLVGCMLACVRCLYPYLEPS